MTRVDYVYACLAKIDVVLRQNGVKIMVFDTDKVLILSSLILLAIISVFAMDFITIENIKNNKDLLAGFVETQYFLSVLMFFLSCAIFINSPVPLAALVKLLGGFFFGFYWGTFYNIVATILACLIGFSISRYAFKAVFERKYYQKLKVVEKEIEKNGFYYFLSLRLVMLVPYFLINILAGISRISFRHYLYSTCLGVMPASLIYANAGNKLEQIESIQQVFRADVLLAMVLVVVCLLFPILKGKVRLPGKL